KGLTSKDTDVRAAAAVFLEKIGPKGAAAVPALLNALDYPELRVRRSAQGALSKVSVPDSLPALLQAVKDKRPKVPAGAVRLLRHYPKQGQVVVPVLLVALQDEDYVVRRNAAMSLSNFDSRASEVVPALIRAMKDKHVPATRQELSVAQAAVYALGDIGWK